MAGREDVVELAPKQLLKAALTYAGWGWKVFPLHSPEFGRCTCHRGENCGNTGKHPRTARGFKDATTDEATVKRWWKEWPNANIGIATGRSGLAVLDIDPRNDGDQSLADLLARHGELPDGPIALTGGGGQHYYLQGELKSRVLAPGVDLKSAGGYVVAPPSVHESGRSYSWDAGYPGSADVPAAPGWVSDQAALTPQDHATPKAVAESFLGAAFIAAGMAGRGLGAGRVAVLCPWRAEHTTGSDYDGSTLVFGGNPGNAYGHFHCSHSHCAKQRTFKQVLDALPQGAVKAARSAVPEVDRPLPGTETPEDESWRRSLQLDSRGLPTAAPGNAMLFLSHDPAWRECLAYDSFTQKITWAARPPGMAGFHLPEVGEPLLDRDYLFIHHSLLKRGYKCGSDKLMEIVHSAAQQRTRDSLVTWLDGLEWDGKSRVRTWLARYCGAKDIAYSRFVGRSWLISAIARARLPGCQVDHMLILEGPQGVGKTSALRILGGEYYLGDLPDLNNKDSLVVLAGRWIVEVQELASMRGQSALRVKSFLTQSTDVYRPPYGRIARGYPRRCVFAGSTNEGQYLTDPTGGRRYWPVKVGRIKTQALVEAREQIWAEADKMFRDGVVWYDRDSEMHAEIATAQDSRREIDPWESVITERIKGQAFIPISQIFWWLEIDPSRRSNIQTRRINAIMARLNYEKKRGVDPASPRQTRVWGYEKKSKTTIATQSDSS